MDDLIDNMLSGRYLVINKIGRGGMAEVYKVWDAQRSTHLAMKVLNEDLAIDRVFIRRFRREAQTLAQLQHPHIVRFYGLEQDGPQAFILLDFIDGKSLKRVIFDQGGPLHLAYVGTILHPICAALQYAHAEGLIHCDMKPGNVMIDRKGDVLVMDFGIARMADAATATMVGMGTPAYMAPEQARGLDPVPQTDIYALGIILFEMLTGGERPFTGENANTTGSTSEKVRWEQINRDPPSPRKWNPEIAPEIEAIVLKCLAKNPKDRYQTPLELLNTLKRTFVVKGIATAEQAYIPIIDAGEVEAPIELEPVPIPAGKSPELAQANPDVKPAAKQPWLWPVIGVGVIGLALILANMRSEQNVETPTIAVVSSSYTGTASSSSSSREIILPTYTPAPTYTTAPTYTPLPTYTALPLTKTPKPTSKPTKTAKPPTKTPEPTTERPQATPTASNPSARISSEMIEVNLRKSPGYVSKDDAVDVVTKIPAGAYLEILEGPRPADNLQWWRVSWNGYEGWIAEKTGSGRIILEFEP